MKRLSDNAIEIVNELHTEKLAYESEYVPIIDALNRLAEYEDIGLEPEKIVFLKNVVDDAFSDKPEFTEHMRELLRTEKDGRLVVLPCRVGDRVYRVIDDCTFPEIAEQKGCVKGANIEICSLNKPDSVCIYLLMTGSYDEVTTRTREEVEKALKEV